MIIQIREAESEVVVKTKRSVTIDQKLVGWIDKLIEKGLFRNRSHVVEEERGRQKDTFGKTGRKRKRHPLIILKIIRLDKKRARKS